MRSFYFYQMQSMKRQRNLNFFILIILSLFYFCSTPPLLLKIQNAELTKAYVFAIVKKTIILSTSTNSRDFKSQPKFESSEIHAQIKRSLQIPFLCKYLMPQLNGCASNSEIKSGTPNFSLQFQTVYIYRKNKTEILKSARCACRNLTDSYSSCLITYKNLQHIQVFVI